MEVRFSAQVADAVLRDWAETAERNADGSVTVRVAQLRALYETPPR